MIKRSKFLLIGVAAGIPLGTVIKELFETVATADSVTDRAIFLNEFMPNIETQAIRYSQWVKQQPGEYQIWSVYLSAIRAGQNPIPPNMGSKFGKLLVAAGKMAVDTTNPTPLPIVAYPSIFLFPSEVGP